MTCMLLLTGWVTPICAAAQPKAPAISLTLEEALEMALTSNRAYLNAAAGIENQELDVYTSEADFNVRWAPTASAGVTDDTKAAGGGIGIGKRFTSGITAQLLPVIGWQDDEYNSELGITLEVPLLRGFGKSVNLDPIRSAQFALTSARRSLHTRQVNLVISTVTAVYDIIKQMALVEVAEDAVAQLKGHVATAGIREKAGLSTPMDVYRAQIRLKDAEDRLSATRKSLKDAKDRLKLIVALPLETALSVEAPVYFNSLRVDIDETIQTALTQRVEVEEAREAIDETLRKLEIARLNVRPQLDLVLIYNRLGISEQLNETIDFEDERWGVNLVSTTDWARTREKAAYAKSQINARAVKRDYQTRVDEITREVRQQLDFLENAEERIQIREDQVRQGEGKLALAQVKYTYNMADNFDVIEAETELQQARANLLNNQIDHILGLYQLKAVMGTLVERP
ncbi:MAG: TolC family protein [Desulfobacterales bacterium]|jgi:outer membrane protein TolC